MRTLQIAIVGLMLGVGVAQAEVVIDWVTVGDPGNACDTQSEGCFGAVAYEYQIGKYEVTNAQYAQFLNAVAKTDTYGLYHTEMGEGWPGGITRFESSWGYAYSAIAGRGEMPVVMVSFWDALRFANWLHNGQPIGAQDNSTTEDGAYTITAQGVADNSITRNAWATIFLTSEDEWYKAAYFKAPLFFFSYPAGSSNETLCWSPVDVPNAANCHNEVVDLTDVGSYRGSASPNGTFDQGGNVWEWNEAIISGSDRGVRGGAFGSEPSWLAASFRYNGNPATEHGTLGFRVARIPEPGRDVLAACALATLALLRRRAARSKPSPACT